MWANCGTNSSNTYQVVLHRHGQIVSQESRRTEGRALSYRASTASLRTTRFGSSNAFASSRITVVFCGCKTSYRTTLGRVAR